jgi:hypothetical protein
MTGEITLRGDVLPIGGLKEKVLAAKLAGVHTVIVPKLNHRDLTEVPETIKKGVGFHFVEHMDEVLELALLPLPAPAASLGTPATAAQQSPGAAAAPATPPATHPPGKAPATPPAAARQIKPPASGRRQIKSPASGGRQIKPPAAVR